MPEAPELRIIADQLQKLVGQRLNKIYILDVKFSVALHYGKVKSITAIGKKLIIGIDQGYYMFRLGMTGKFYFSPSEYIKVQMEFDDYTLYYDDARKLGSLTWFDTKAELLQFLTKFGMVILNNNSEIKMFHLTKLNKADFNVATQKYNNRQLSAFLMDDSIFDGIGNYLKSEIAFHAGLDITAKLNTFTSADLVRLYHSIDYITTLAYQQGGLTLSDFRDTEGRDGQYIPLIYGRTTTLDGRKVKQTKTADGRTSHHL
jgi:endonuclease-8